ncbi:MAG TPA: response regulator [Bacillota bacterium]|nr:response regulator [Bacillota bacterium]
MARVLLIEDQPALRHLVAEVLREEGHDVLMADDGSSGLAMLDLDAPPDLVLMDLFMPRVGGRAILAHLRGDPRLRSVPVVLMTGAMYDPADFPPRGSYQALLKKPFDLDELTGAVRACLTSAE